jgi:protein-S-isoprenylcysteine O-methyltransferase Ste14
MNFPTSLPRWMARLSMLFIFAVAIPLGHGVVPWALSLMTERHGWTGGVPSAWNVLGLGPLAFGIGLLAWIAIVAMRSVPPRLALGSTGNYLLTSGPYRVTRNPMYLAELSLWFGWMLVFGSLAVGLGFAALIATFHWFLVPWEERSLQRRLGDRYRAYATATPRWFRRL